ncbi:MAG: fumarylacetoacetate hydrolase family protein [Arenicellales bacterium]|nr:fumarylacetoacetate hydrolase family protein [Arenicellales bacterium]
MKLLSFFRLDRPGFGAVVDDGIIDLTGRLPGQPHSLRTAIAEGQLASAMAYVDGRVPELSTADVIFLPPITDPAKILCIGLNYAKHQAETGRPDVDHPTIFTRFADSQVGHLQPMIKPDQSVRFDYEAELAVVIGQGGRFISEDDALSHVAGYACYNDGSIRDWQRHTSQFTPGKNFPGTGAFGPYMVTPDEVGDYRKLPIESRLNGEVMQKATLADLIFPIPRLISYISEFTALSPGDVIVTGTPGGVGDRREPPVYLTPGDVIEVDIGIVGTLVNPITSVANI